MRNRQHFTKIKDLLPPITIIIIIILKTKTVAQFYLRFTVRKKLF